MVRPPLPPEVDPVSSSATLMAVAATVLAVATTASAAGFDLRGVHGGAPGVASGHSDIAVCSETTEVSLSHLLVPRSGNNGNGNGNGGQQWVVDGVDVTGPGDLATLCDGWEITVAVERKDGSAVVTSTEQLSAGVPLPTLSVTTPVARGDVSGTAVLLTPSSVTVSMDGGGA